MSQDELTTEGNPIAGWLDGQLSRRELMRRMAVFGLAVPSVAALIEACGGSTATGQVHVPSSSTKGSLTIWGWKDSLDALKLQDADFTTAYPGISYTYVPRPPASTYRNIELAVTAGSGGPDVALIEDSHLTAYVQLGAMADLTDLVGPYIDQIDSYKWDWTKKGSRYFAMPWDPGPVAVFYRRDVFQQAGVDPASMATWDDFHQAAQTIKEKTGLAMWQQSKARNDGRLFETLLWQQGTGYVDDKGHVILDKDPKVATTLDYINSFWQEGLASDQEAWTNPWYKAQTDGTTATVVDAVWMGTFFKSWIAPKASGKWGVFPLPAWKPGGSRASNDGGSALAIFDSSQQKEAAWAYVQFHLGRPASQLQIYEKTDIFPSLKATYKDPFFQQPDPYFGDQTVRDTFAQIAERIPKAGIYSKDYAQMNALLVPEIQKLALGQQSVQAALSNAAGLIRDKTHRA
jgi:lactose/L-arabinose transport system substrate-binding protein